MWIDRDVACRPRPVAAALEQARASQGRTVVLGQPRDLTEVIGPALHRPDLHPALGVCDVLVERPNYGAGAATHLADLGHRGEELATLFLLHAIVHRLQHPA